MPKRHEVDSRGVRER